MPAEGAALDGDGRMAPAFEDSLPRPRGPRGPRRWLWITAGFVACGLGFAGMLLPGLPSTVFFLLAAACFSRGSHRLLRWLLSLPKVGPMVRDYRAGLGMPLSAKVTATVLMGFFVALSLSSLPYPWLRVLVVGLAAVGAMVIWRHVPTRPRSAVSPGNLTTPSSPSPPPANS